MLSSTTLSEVRQTYFLATEDETATEALLKMCEDESKVEYIAYKGVAYTLKASFAYNPIKKLNYFEKGKQLIEKAVKKEPYNVEMRFLRLTVQQGAPTMLGYYSEIEKDKKYVVKNMDSSSLPNWYKQNIHAYLNSK